MLFYSWCMKPVNQEEKFFNGSENLSSSDLNHDCGGFEIF